MLELVTDQLDLGIVMHDAPAMMRFYGEILELPLKRSFPMPGIGTRHHFAVGTNSIKLIELDEPLEPVVASLPWKGSGMRYWTVHISNLDEVMARVTDAGVKPLLDVQQVGPTVRYALVPDADGNCIEFVEGA
jgi:glyoxylase I family protein